MFRCRTPNNVTNKIHEQALRLMLNDYKSDFDALPTKQ